MNLDQTPKIIIVGAGPAGCACALMLAKKGINVTLIDKSTFPRDKICGDALSPDVMNQLGMISKELADGFHTIGEKWPIYGGTIITSNHQKLNIPLAKQKRNSEAFTCSRIVFDHYLFEAVCKNRIITVIQNSAVTHIHRKSSGLVLNTIHGDYEADLVIGADGAQSIVSRQFNPEKLDKQNYCAGLRVYYENVCGYHESNHIELYFLKEVMPGYVWIFPMKDGKANVGIGMLSSHISKKKINLKDLLNNVIETHPQFQHRFKNAKALEPVKGFGLPLGSKKRSISGDRYLLTGDAASLIDPLSGEGIGNAIRSGRVAAEHILECIKANNYSAAFNKKYDTEIYRRMWPELKVSHRIQQCLRYPRLLEFVIKKANKNKKIHQLMIDLLEDMDQKKQLLNPRFYWNLLFNK